MKLPIIFFLVIFSAGIASPEKYTGDTIFMIRIISNAKSANISSNSRFYMRDTATNEKKEFTSGNIYLLKPYKSGMIFSGEEIPSSYLQFIPRDKKSHIYVNGRPYRGTIYIRNKNGRLTVINEIFLEDYIYGILPKELDIGWPTETLKVQAIVSRTYALLNRDRHSSEGYNLCNEIHCQVYGGIDSETERTNSAVDATEGKILTYNGKLADTVFHACCGGNTEKVTDVWKTYGEVPVYLRGVNCKFCTDSPHYRWSNTMKSSVIKERMEKSGYSAERILTIRIDSKARSGRARTITITYRKTNGKYAKLTLTANDFRLMVSPWLIRSAFIKSIHSREGNFIFGGKGWGHAVGLCQWGAKTMAVKGYNHREILLYYFPGTAIETLRY